MKKRIMHDIVQTQLKKQVRSLKKRIPWKKLVCMVMLIIYCFSMTGCYTLLNDTSIEFVSEESDAVNADINSSDAEKYISDYPDAFVFLDGHSDDTEDVISFNILECIDLNTFVYSYQTMVNAAATPTPEPTAGITASLEAVPTPADVSSYATGTATATGSKQIASVLMSYNHVTKEKKVIWETVSDSTDVVSFYTQPIYAEPDASGEGSQCTGYMVFFNGEINILKKNGNTLEVAYQNNIDAYIEYLFQNNKDQAYSGSTYEINGVTLDGDFNDQLDIQVNMSIINKNVDEVLNKEVVPSVTYNPNPTDDGSGEEDTNNTVDSVADSFDYYSLFFTIKQMPGMSFTAESTNVDEQIKLWKKNTEYSDSEIKAALPSFYGECTASNGMKLYEEKLSQWIIPRCVNLDRTSWDSFSNYVHSLVKGKDLYYYLFDGKITKVVQVNKEAERTVVKEEQVPADSADSSESSGDNPSGVPQQFKTVTTKIKEAANFTEKITYYLNDGLYGISWNYSKDDSTYTYLCGKYIIEYSGNHLYLKHAENSDITMDKVYEKVWGIKTNSDIASAGGVLIDGKFCILISDEKYLYLYNMKKNKMFQISLSDICYNNRSSDRTTSDASNNPDLYSARCITESGNCYYISSIFSGLITINASTLSISQISDQTCYGRYVNASSGFMLGYDNTDYHYFSSDIIHAKCIPVDKFNNFTVPGWLSHKLITQTPLP